MANCSVHFCSTGHILFIAHQLAGHLPHIDLQILIEGPFGKIIIPSSILSSFKELACFMPKVIFLKVLSAVCASDVTNT